MSEEHVTQTLAEIQSLSCLTQLEELSSVCQMIPGLQACSAHLQTALQAQLKGERVQVSPYKLKRA